jgi:hypothetical protein
MVEYVGLSIRAYSRHRDCSDASVRQAIRSGRLVESLRRDALGRLRILPELADREWAMNTRHEHRPPTAGEITPEPLPPAAPPPVPAQASNEPDEALNGAAALAEARRRKELALAELAERKLQRDRGEWVRVDEVLSALEDAFVSCRTRLLSVPSKVKSLRPELTLEQLAIIDQQIRDALEDLAEGRVLRSSGAKHE